MDQGVAPDFSITSFDGETLTLSELRGQAVVLNFWASWCPPCREEAPYLEWDIDKLLSEPYPTAN